jgi:hypothetical protein
MGTVHPAPAPRPRPSRKIRLDCDVYRPHSMRASSGDAECDHDFERAPTVVRPRFAVWTCTRCGRAFQFEVWGSAVASSPGRPLQAVD